MYRLILAVAATITLVSPVFAQETRASAAAKFRTEFAASDTNKDGVLTRAEVQARIRQMKVGKGAPDPVHAKRLADLWFTHADADGNGKVTLAESEALLAATFDRYDANHDGKIGPPERGTPGR